MKTMPGGREVPELGDHLWHWMYGGGYIDHFRKDYDGTVAVCEFYGNQFIGDELREVDVRELTTWIPQFSGCWMVECPWLERSGSSI